MEKFGILIRLLATVIFLLGLILSPGDSLAQAQAEKEYKFGTVDFTAYWAAFQFFKDGRNPYDLDAVKAGTVIQDKQAAPPKVVWNPPVLFVFLWPLLNHDYTTSYLLMMAVNVLAWFAIALLSWKIFDESERPNLKLITAGILFYPACSTLYFGQLSLILALALCLGLLALKRKQDLLAGLLFVPLVFKPHTFYLLGIVLAYWIFRTRRWSVVSGFVAGVSVLSAVTWLISPQAFNFWLSIPRPPIMFKSATLVTTLREILVPFYGSPPYWPIYTIPFISVIAVFALIKWKVADSKLENFLIPVLCLSCLTAPYGWTFDQSILLIAQGGLISMFYHSKFTSKQFQTYYYTLLIVNLLAFMLFALVPSEEYFWWYPLLPLALWYLVSRQLRVAKV